MKPHHILDTLFTFLFFFLAFSNAVAAVTLQLSETDFSHREDQGSLEAVLEARGGFSGTIVVEIIPMSVSDFLNQGLTPVPQVIADGNLHHATPGDDFNATTLTFTLDGQSSLVEKTARINIVDDIMSEYEEIFVLVLKVVNATEGIDITISRNVSVARIRQDSDDSNTRVSFNIATLEVNEGDGVLNNTLFIEIEGIAEPTLYINISINSDDIRLLQSDFAIPTGVQRVPVPLEIVDDNIIEDWMEYMIIDMSSAQQSSLFSMGDFSSVSVTVQDNDRPHFGFKVYPPAESDTKPLQLLEGETVKICALMVDNEEYQTDMEVVVQFSPESAKPLLEIDGIPDRPYLFSDIGNQLMLCFNVTAKEDDVISGVTPATFSLIPKVIFGPAEMERVDTDDLQIVIVDNDGLPNPPSDVNLELTNNGKDLLITWKADQSISQPISQFRITVKTTDISGSSSSGKSKRQTDDNSGPNVQEHTTVDTQLLLDNVEGDKTYAIKVCAENGAGQACALPKEVTIKLQDGRVPVLQITGGLQPSSNGGTKSLPTGYIVAIVLLPLLFILLLCLLICCLVYCTCRCGKSKNYFPSEQEKKIESKYKEAMDERYRNNFTSMESITSTTSSVSDFTPV